MTPAVQRQEPPYLQIVEHVRRQIRSGQLQDGDMIPSVRQLARDWKVSPPTAGKAMATLRSEGYVRGMPGKGTVVCAGSTTHYPGGERLRSARSTGRIYPPGEHAVIRSAELVTAPPQIADALGLAHGATVIRRHRITYRGEAPISASVTWLDGALAQDAPRLLSTERIIEGTIGYIRQVTGREAVRGTDQDSARAATGQDAEDLGVPPGSPVACGRNWWYDAGDTVIEYGERVSVPGRWSTHEYSVT
jgi:DNA-binding GntR family transcriptional regulator